MSKSKQKAILIRTVDSDLLTSNYGSFFQHYCLRANLKRLGYAVSRDSLSDPGPLSASHYLVRFLKCFVRYLLAGLRIKGDMRDSMVRLRCAGHLRRRFGFVRDYRRMMGPDACNGDVCAVILGGDQVMYAQTVSSLAARFAAPRWRLIAYSASSDWKRIQYMGNGLTDFLPSLRSFSALGLREQMGVDLFAAQLPGIVSPHKVVDPVLLCSSQDLFTVASKRKVFTEKTLFGYFLGEIPDHERFVAELEETAHALSCRLHIVAIQGADYQGFQKYMVSLSPSEFLAAYRDAAYVVTNSFHGLVFALQAEKPFVSVPQIDNPQKAQNVRHEELLASVGLNDKRLRKEGCRMADLLTGEYHWVHVKAEVSRAREESLNWLREALTDA